MTTLRIAALLMIAIGPGLAGLVARGEWQEPPKVATPVAPAALRPAITGVVRKPDGSPASGVSIHFASERHRILVSNGRLDGNAWHPTATAEADGSFRFEPQEEAGWVVVLDDAGFAILLEESLRGMKTIDLVSWGRIEGEVRSGTVTLPGAEVWASPMGLDKVLGLRRVIDVQADAVADKSGRFVVDRAIPGETSMSRFVRLGAGMGMSQSAKVVEVRPGEVTKVTIGGGGRHLVGRVAVPRGSDLAVDWKSSYRGFSRPIPMIPIPPGLKADERRVWLQTWSHSPPGMAQRAALKDRGMHAVFIEADGTFRVEDVRPGTYELSIQAMPPGRKGAAIGIAKVLVVVPEIDDGDLAKPLDIGTIELRSVK